MHAALLYTLNGDGDRLSSDLAGGLPAADVSGTSYLDGRTIYDGTLAGRVAEDVPSPVVSENGIAEATKEREREVLADIYADPETGWAGVASSDGEELLLSYLRTHGLRAESAVIDLDAVAKALPDEADHKGIIYSQSFEEHGRDAAGAEWHNAAQALPSEGLSALAVEYDWDGIRVDGMIAASGYVAIYPDWTTDTFGRWVADQIEPHLTPEREADAQETLPEACEDCGRRSVDIRERHGAALCPVCADKRDEEEEVA